MRVWSEGLKVLVTGSGKSGSWQIRGAQLGAAIGADVQPHASDVAGYDLAIVVKRPPLDLLGRLHRAGVPLVWDVVDAWPQPVGNEWDRVLCMEWMKKQVCAIRPSAIVAATRAMADDCAQFGIPVLALPHHARPGQRLNAIREKVAVVGYEGSEQFMTGRWRAIMETECAERGWKFVTNPASLAELDIVVAMRDQAGYAATTWKSNVKLANAQGSGTPFIGAAEAGYLETASGAERFVSTRQEVSRAFDELTPMAARLAVASALCAAAPTLPVVARKYLDWIRTL